MASFRTLLQREQCISASHDCGWPSIARGRRILSHASFEDDVLRHEQRLRFGHDLLPGDPDDARAGGDEHGIAAAIAFEAEIGGVERSAIDLHDKSFRSPAEIDLMARDVDVRFRIAKARSADEPEKAFLGLRAGEGDARLALLHAAEPGGARAAGMAIEQRENLRTADEGQCEASASRRQSSRSVDSDARSNGVLAGVLGRAVRGGIRRRYRDPAPAPPAAGSLHRRDGRPDRAAQGLAPS